ncbi:MAG: peptide chain release factor 2 [Bacillota bacterium]|nr:peptide chain release factor 2 [Bacillota bacterium]
MFEEMRQKAEYSWAKVEELRRSLDVAARAARVSELETRMAAPDFWNDPEEAKKLVKNLTEVKRPLDKVQGLEARARDAREMLDLIEAESDLELAGELEREIDELEADLKEFELLVLLSGKYDSRAAIVSLHAGAGGTDAQDWVEILLRMYTRWAERHGFATDLLDSLPGEEAGLKSVTIGVKGEYAYGFLKSEKGVHRLVRISPFDASSRRHTSFASVEVLPEIEEDNDIEIKPEDLRIDTYRSSGAGGQHVNKTDSAVRITHIPTGVVVACQNERSQHANKETAMRIVKARLADLREQEREKEIASLRGAYQEIAWGSQIRSYVFQPYSLVKDHRTGVEEGNVQAVMDGDIDQFIQASLREHLQKNGHGRLHEVSP